jgi:hypothetical protein
MCNPDEAKFASRPDRVRYPHPPRGYYKEEVDHFFNRYFLIVIYLTLTNTSKLDFKYLYTILYRHNEFAGS